LRGALLQAKCGTEEVFFIDRKEADWVKSACLGNPT